MKMCRDTLVGEGEDEGRMKERSRVVLVSQEAFYVLQQLFCELLNRLLSASDIDKSEGGGDSEQFICSARRDKTPLQKRPGLNLEKR